MASLASLWLPIVVSAVIVFLASWVVHMFLPHHRSDFAMRYALLTAGVFGWLWPR